MIVCDTGKTRIAPAYVNAAGFAASGPKVGEARSVRVDDTLLIREAQQGLTGSQEDAQDIYQEAFLRAYINLARFRFECSFYTWIYRIVTNLCLDHLRKKNSRGRDVTTTVSPDCEEEEVLNRMPDHRPGASPERSLVGRELRRCILRALGRLSPRERMVFELKHYHGLRLRTVAGILNTTEGTIKNTLFRATHKLRTQLAEVR